MPRCQSMKTSTAPGSIRCTTTDDARAPRTSRRGRRSSAEEGFMRLSSRNSDRNDTSIASLCGSTAPFPPHSVRHFPWPGLVLLPDFDGLLGQQPGQGKPALLRRKGQFLVEEPIVKLAVLQRVIDRRTIVDVIDLGPVCGCHAHGTGFAGRVKGTARQLVASQRDAGQADGLDLTVPGRIVAS